MADFVYLYWNRREDQVRMATSTPEEKQKITQKWMVWMDGLQKSGNLKDFGAPLEFEGRTVEGAKKVVTDGPYAEAKDIVGGFSIITANSLNEALELSKGCPILELNGIVEVRPIRPLQGLK
jgi:hypothetical protein